MSENRDNVFIDVKSTNSVRTLTELVNDAFNERTITICQYCIGAHMPSWRGAMRGDESIYAIDDVGCAGGEITFLLKQAYRPRWYPDNGAYNNLIHFAHGMNCKVFNKHWVQFMVKQHQQAIDAKRWLFIVLAVITPTYRLHGNRSLLLEKAKDMIEAEEEREIESARMAMGEYFQLDNKITNDGFESERYSG